MFPNTFYRVSVKALIRDSQNRVLVVKEKQETWSLPGGGLDHGEDPKEGILRELREELGIMHAQINEIVTIKSFYLEQKSTWLMWIVYGVSVDSGVFVLGEGVTAAEYLDTTMLETSRDIFEQMVYEASNRQSLHVR